MVSAGQAALAVNSLRQARSSHDRGHDAGGHQLLHISWRTHYHATRAVNARRADVGPAGVVGDLLRLSDVASRQRLHLGGKRNLNDRTSMPTRRRLGGDRYRKRFAIRSDTAWHPGRDSTTCVQSLSYLLSPPSQ